MAMKRNSTLAAVGIIALTLVGTATSAFADRNQYTRGRMMMHHHGHWHHGYHRHWMGYHHGWRHHMWRHHHRPMRY